ncbi:unnamed protein product [Cylindrotheca closterium]|uniref:MYND-type domain-containing protein n=1 Tax=Cylindrotheca closterium TaxID=2856 RepID=A0AAD2G8H7_9STRA|nr:unnamed protein product [Cylindrotheca closterium]
MNAPLNPSEKVQKLKSARDLLIARCKLLTPYSDDWYLTRKQLQQITEEGEITAEQVRVYSLKASFEKAYPDTAVRKKDWQCPICKEGFHEYLDDPSSWLPCCQRRICKGCRDGKPSEHKKCPSCQSKEYFPLNKLDEVYKIQDIEEPWAHLRMALLLEENGRHDKAAEYLWKAVDASHPVAICHLGQAHYTGSNPNIPQSNENARALFLKSAKQGYPEAQYNLGLFCLEEDINDVAPSTQESRAMQAQKQRRKIQIQQEGLRWISLAAVGGSVTAQGMLATMYCNSLGQEAPVKKNMFLAKYWAQQGATKGDGSCQLVLAQVLMILASQTFDGSYNQVGYNPIPRVLFLLRKTAAANDDESSSIQTETNKENALKTLRNMEGQISVKCANCNAQNVPLSQCRQCRGVHYCSKTCSTEHWKKGHKLDCLKKEETSELEDYLHKISVSQPPAGTGLSSIAEDLATPTAATTEMVEPTQAAAAAAAGAGSIWSGNALN